MPNLILELACVPRTSFESTIVNDKAAVPAMNRRRVIGESSFFGGILPSSNGLRLLEREQAVPDIDVPKRVDIFPDIFNKLFVSGNLRQLFDLFFPGDADARFSLWFLLLSHSYFAPLNQDLAQ
jgi:hypothetical protein